MANKAPFSLTLILMFSSWVQAKESSSVCVQAMSPNKEQALAPLALLFLEPSLWREPEW